MQRFWKIVLRLLLVTGHCEAELIMRETDVAVTLVATYKALGAY